MPPRSKTSRSTTAVIAGCLIAATASAATSDRWNLPIATKKLDNGLTVVVSEDHSSPTVGISVIYRVGIRTEPRDRSGFAHLFEHLMFEGTPKVPHGVFDRVTSDGGGDNNGATHPDFTSYIERAPVSALEPLLWLEADRMQALAFSKRNLDGQRDVVKEEINVNVKNQPYGGFAETDLPALAFQKWENGHDGYGSFDDLDKASLDDVRAFHRDFYGPNNAVLGIAGDVTPEQGFALAQKYFGAIPRRATPPRPDVSEPLNTAEKRIVEGDGLAKLPGLAIGWKMPARGSRDQAAMIVLGELLAGGDASRLYQTLVRSSALAVHIDAFAGGGSPWEYDGPTLFTLAIIYRREATADLLLSAIDSQIALIEKEGVDPQTLQGLKTRMLADWYSDLEPFVDRAETLAILQAVWGDARVANQVPDLIDGVTSADIQRVAAIYLTHPNRSVIDRRPDFMLAVDDPARSDARGKRKAPPPPREGKVSLGEAHSVNPVPTPAQSGKLAPATAPAAGPDANKNTTSEKSPVDPSSGKAPASQPASATQTPAALPSAKEGPAASAANPAAADEPSGPADKVEESKLPPTAAAISKPATSTAPAGTHDSKPIETVKPEVSKPEASKPADSSSEPTRFNAVTPGGAMPETSSTEPPKLESAKPAAAKPETAKPEIAKPETAKPETAKPETASTEAAKTTASRPDVARPAADKPVAGKSDAPKKEAAKPKLPEQASPASPAVDAASGKD